jgi:hypothetical protein
MTKLRKGRVAGNLSLMEQNKTPYRYWCGKVKRFPGRTGDRWEDNIKIYRTGCSGFVQYRKKVFLNENCNKFPCSVKCEEFRDWLRYCWLLNKDCFPCS